MAPSTEPPEDRRPAQGRWLLIFLAIVIGTCLLMDATARNRQLERWMTAKSSELSVKNGMLFSNNGSFIDYEERMLLDEMPNTDFSRGGLYFFGTSNMKWGFTTWDLPDSLRQRLHNYGTGAASHRTILRLVRYVGDKGVFAAGNKSHVIIGVSYHLGTTEIPQSYFPALVRRQGVYEISPDDRLVEAPLSPADRWFRIEKARCGGFMRNSGRIAKNWLLAGFGLSHQPPHDPDNYRLNWQLFMGPDWRQNIDRELGYLDQTLALLHANGVPVTVVLLPQGSWMDGLPYVPYYDDRVRSLTRATSTPLLDLSASLPDSDFIDSNHLTVAGQTKFRGMLLKDQEAYLRGPPK